LLNEIEQILIEHDLDLERNREQLKAIRRGEWTEQQIYDYFDQKEIELESVYAKSTLPYGPDEGKIKSLLLECLEIHYGSLSSVINIESKIVQAIREIKVIADGIIWKC